MKERKAIQVIDNLNQLNIMMNEGWEVISTTAHHVAITGSSYNKVIAPVLVILEREAE